MALRRGQIVAVDFLDHCDDGKSPLRFTVYGRLAHITKTALYVDSWCYTDRRRSYDVNVNRHTIMRAAVIGVKTLTEEAE